MSASGWRHLHAVMAVVWVALLIPAWMWWRDSVYFVIAASLYANAAVHWGAWQAARAETATARMQEQVDALHRAVVGRREGG